MAINLSKIDPDVSYTLKQTADILDVHYNTVLKLKKNGDLKCKTISSRYYVDGEDILRYVNNDDKS